MYLPVAEHRPRDDQHDDRDPQIFILHISSFTAVLQLPQLPLFAYGTGCRLLFFTHALLDVVLARAAFRFLHRFGFASLLLRMLRALRTAHRFLRGLAGGAVIHRSRPCIDGFTACFLPALALLLGFLLSGRAGVTQQWRAKAGQRQDVLHDASP
ncbi:MAG TPA: hypothetical protein VN361_00295 [Oxalicibacterium sp.]|nr:hypothetical protein [Oxalicibacterium sp.]